MFLGVFIVWLSVFGYHLLFTCAAIPYIPCVAYSGNVMYFIYPNAITRFDTVNNGTSTQDLSVGPSLDNICVQQPSSDWVLIGDITPVINVQAQGRISGEHAYKLIARYEHCKHFVLMFALTKTQIHRHLAGVDFPSLSSH